jgi:hypothetical protein
MCVSHKLFTNFIAFLCLVFPVSAAKILGYDKTTFKEHVIADRENTNPIFDFLTDAETLPYPIVKLTYDVTAGWSIDQKYLARLKESR